MPGTKEIRLKIRSVQNTRKITKAMEMVAASKMRKAQERMRHARPYGEKIRNVAAHISHANPEYRHPFLVERDTVKGVGMIVITTDKGLCGAINVNNIRAATRFMNEHYAEGQRYVTVGRKGRDFLLRYRRQVIAEVSGVADRPTMAQIRSRAASSKGASPPETCCPRKKRARPISPPHQTAGWHRERR